MEDNLQGKNSFEDDFQQIKQILKQVGNQKFLDFKEEKQPEPVVERESPF